MRPSSGLMRLLGASLSGLIYPLAFSPFDFFWLAPLSIGVLFLTWRSASPRQAMLCGFLFGMASVLVGVSWIYVSLHTFGNMPPVLAATSVVVFGAIMALYPMLVGGLLGCISRRSDAWQWLVFAPVLWVLGEWLRGVLLSGFPWLFLGYSQVDTPLAALFPLVGTLGVSLWMTFAVGAVLTLIFDSRTRRSVPVAVFASLLLLAVLARLPSFVAPQGSPIRLAVIQNNLSLSQKWDATQARLIAERFKEQSVALRDVDLVVWPEVALPFYLDELHPGFIGELQAHEADYLVGLLLREQPRVDAPYYNAALGLGSQAMLYRKHQLVPFGEYLPLAFLLRWLLDYLHIPMSDFSPGPLQQSPMRLAGTAIGVSICYEDAFSRVISASAGSAQVLANLSEDAWFGDSLAPHQRLQMARARVLETGRPMVRASNSGLSSLIRHDGQVIKKAGQFEEAIVRGELQPMSGTTPFVRFQETPVIALCLLLLMLGAWRQFSLNRRDGAEC